MNGPYPAHTLAEEADFRLGPLTVSPSSGRVYSNDGEFRVEALTMRVLVTLARARGATVSRDDLVGACWQGRIVSDDAVARAIAKVRALERTTAPAAFTLETVPKIGYRLIAAPATARPRPRAPLARVLQRWSSLTVRARISLGVGALAAAGLIAATSAMAPTRGVERPAAVERPSIAFTPVHSAEFSDALLVLDEPRLRLYLAHGWDPNWKLDSEGNAALHNLMMVCERNPFHDREGLTRVARLLVDSGADPTTRNKWNDTPLIIAATPRYCGPQHPVVAYLKAAIAARR